MKRLCIYLIYDSDKVIDRYIGAVLDGLQEIADHLVVVCNFDRIKSGAEYIEGKYDQIFFRENKGYDAGAYKDTLDRLLTWETAYGYDELLLTNDTYMGPLYPFGEMFDAMSDESCDFWGITRHPKGVFDDGYHYPAHIQSYFLNFKKKVFHSEAYRHFWDAYKLSDDKMDTIYAFELGINTFLTDKGYMGKAYMDLFPFDFADTWMVNPYCMYPYELIRDGRIPVIKKIAMFFNNQGYVNALKALAFIEQNLDYDVDMIREYVDRTETTKSDITTYDFKALEEFVKGHGRIYVYGRGVWADTMTDYFSYRGWELAGYFVTELMPGNEGAEKFSKATLSEKDGIIVAQRYKENGMAIYRTLMEKCTPLQVFMPVYR